MDMHKERELLENLSVPRDPLKDLPEKTLNWEGIDECRRRRDTVLSRGSVRRYWKNLMYLPRFKTRHFAVSSGTVEIGDPAELEKEQLQTLKEVLRDLKPWRKGPFSYFGTNVDGEWRSDLKWQRVLDLFGPDFTGKIIADVGCNNTYYMCRILPEKPRLVLGLDPMERYYFHFLLNQRFLKSSSMGFELMGAEDLPLFPELFDLVLFMGILYHRRHPLHALQSVARSLRRGGEILVETAGIPGEDPVCLFPEDRYMKAPGYWFLPTAKAAENMLKRTGFTCVETLGSFPLTEEEQRRTPWVGTESLSDFIDPRDPEKTVEGYPRQLRIFLRGVKK